MGVTTTMVETPTEAMIAGMTTMTGEEMTMEVTMGTATTTGTAAAAARRKEHVKNSDTMFLTVTQEKH